MKWREITGLHQNKEIDKGRTGLRLCYNTASLCEYVPILSMPIPEEKTFCAITFDPELRSSPNFDTTQPRPYTTSIGGATIAL